MTLGVTGVVWLPRGATLNSTGLTTGTGPLPIGAAGPAWAGVAAAFAEAAITLGRVRAELTVGWDSPAGNRAVNALGPFTAWANDVAARASGAARKAGVGCGAYATALFTMPSLPEIAAVQTAKAAAYTTGGVTNGSAAAAEAAEKALDLRAAAAMEAYEAASVYAALPERFSSPPALTIGTSDGPGATAGGVRSRADQSPDVRGPGARGYDVEDGKVRVVDPVRRVADGAMAAVHHAGAAVGDAVSQAGVAVSQAASAVSQTASAVSGTVGSLAAGAGTDVAAALGDGHAPTVATATGTPSGATVAGASTGVHAAATIGVGGTGAITGLGSVGSIAGAAAGGGIAAGSGLVFGSSGAATGTPSHSAGTTVRAVAGDTAGTAHAAAPASTTRRDAAPEDHRAGGIDAGTDVEHFVDGRTVVPAVLGAEPGR